MKVTVYLPDDLAAEVRAELGDANVSAICQAALRAELERARSRAKVTEEGFSRVEAYDNGRGRTVAFQGQRVGHVDLGTDGSITAYLTPKDAVAVHYDLRDTESLDVYEDFRALAGSERINQSLLGQVAEALGEEWTEELDI